MSDIRDYRRGVGLPPGRPPRTKTWRLNHLIDSPNQQGTVLAPFPLPAGFDASPRNLIDGIAGLGFFPRTFYLGLTDTQLNLSNRWPEAKDWIFAGDGTITGFVEVEVRGMLSGSGFWFRRFQIAPFQQIAIPMETFSDLRIDVVAATAVNFDVTAFASEDLLILEKGSRVFLPQLDTGVTTYTTPPGAVELVPLVAAPDFRWRSLLDPGLFGIPVPLFVGVPVPVLGGAYLPGVDPFRGTWRISL